MPMKKILIVDDEPDFTVLVKMALERVGEYEVRVLNDPLQAVATARDFMPDLILLDMMMPEMDGSEVAQKIKEDEAVRDIPVVFLTGTITRSNTDSPVSVIGGRTFIAKPVNIRELVDCIRKYIKK